MRKGVTVVPSSAPSIDATARDNGIAPEAVKATTIESNAPLLWSSAVVIQPAKTALVVSLTTRTMFWARNSPIRAADSLIRTMAEMKK